jgi:hypothetical protein
MKELTLERSPMYVSTVGKHLLIPNTSKDMKELTLQKSPMYVSNVEKLSFVPVTLKNMT